MSSSTTINNKRTPNGERRHFPFRYETQQGHESTPVVVKNASEPAIHAETLPHTRSTTPCSANSVGRSSPGSLSDYDGPPSLGLPTSGSTSRSDPLDARGTASFTPIDTQACTRPEGGYYGSGIYSIGETAAAAAPAPNKDRATTTTGRRQEEALQCVLAVCAVLSPGGANPPDAPTPEDPVPEEPGPDPKKNKEKKKSSSFQWSHFFTSTPFFASLATAVHEVANFWDPQATHTAVNPLSAVHGAATHVRSAFDHVVHQGGGLSNQEGTQAAVDTATQVLHPFHNVAAPVGSAFVQFANDPVVHTVAVHLGTFLTGMTAIRASIIMENRFEAMESRFDELENRFDGLENRFNGLENRFDGLENRFNELENRFDEMEKRFDALENRFDEMEKRFDALENRFDEMEKRFDSRLCGVHARINGLVDAVDGIHARLDNLERIVVAGFASLHAALGLVAPPTVPTATGAPPPAPVVYGPQPYGGGLPSVPSHVVEVNSDTDEESS